MATPNVRGAYELVRRAMQQNALQQQGADSDPAPFGAPEYDPDGYGSLQGGLLGRLLALQAEQKPYQPLADNSQAAPSVSPDPNFRQLSRVPAAVRPNRGINGFNTSDDQSNSPYPPVNDDYRPDVSRAFGPGLGETNARSETPTPVLAGFPRIGNAMPWPAIAPGPISPIPIPQLPEWWNKAQELLKLYGMVRYGRVGGGNRNNDDDFCDNRKKEEDRKCEAHREDIVHPDHYFGCLGRAKTRWDLCNRNYGRRRRWDEPLEWNPPEDEDVWINPDR